MLILRSLFTFCLVTPFVLSLSSERVDLSKSVEKSDEISLESINTEPITSPTSSESVDISKPADKSDEVYLQSINKEPITAHASSESADLSKSVDNSAEVNLVSINMEPITATASSESVDLSKSVDKSDEVSLESINKEPFIATSLEQHLKEKINWGPVWDDIEGINEFVLRYENEKENCGATPGEGLQNLIEQYKKLLPLTKIMDIIHLCAKDPEIKALDKFLQSPDFKAKIISIENSREFEMLQSYTCTILHLDILHMRRNIDQISEESEKKQCGGINGLVLKIESVIPYEKLEHLYKTLMKSDEELVKAVANLQSPEFQQMLRNLRNNVPAYKELREQLKSIGVPVDEIGVYAESIL